MHGRRSRLGRYGLQWRHPTLKTPVFDQMAESGLRLNHFYAAAPVCSPTRASVLTGRTPNLAEDPKEEHNLVDSEPTRTEKMQAEIENWLNSVTESLRGKDY